MSQYLILHKVRGEPAFDIGEMIEVGDEAWWIISTSGHRAYPYRHWELTEICARDDHMYRSVTNFTDPIPKDWPDHYECKGEVVQPKIDIGKLLSKLAPKIHRRF
jgi:hypothetical protein